MKDATEDIAHLYDFPDMEAAMPKPQSLFLKLGALFSPLGWGVIATAFSIGLILFVALGGVL